MNQTFLQYGMYFQQKIFTISAINKRNFYSHNSILPLRGMIEIEEPYLTTS